MSIGPFAILFRILHQRNRGRFYSGKVLLYSEIPVRPQPARRRQCLSMVPISRHLTGFGSHSRGWRTAGRPTAPTSAHAAVARGADAEHTHPPRTREIVLCEWAQGLQILYRRCSSGASSGPAAARAAPRAGAADGHLRQRIGGRPHATRAYSTGRACPAGQPNSLCGRKRLWLSQSTTTTGSGPIRGGHV